MLSMKHFRFLAMAILAALAVSLAAALPGVSADGGAARRHPSRKAVEPVETARLLFSRKRPN